MVPAARTIQYGYADETVKRLKTEALQDQWTFHTEDMLSFILCAPNYHLVVQVYGAYLYRITNKNKVFMFSAFIP